MTKGCRPFGPYLIIRLVLLFSDYYNFYVVYLKKDSCIFYCQKNTPLETNDPSYVFGPSLPFVSDMQPSVKKRSLKSPFAHGLLSSLWWENVRCLRINNR